MASLNIFCLDLLDFLNEVTKKIRKGKHKKKPIKNFQKYFIAHYYMPKISHGPHKIPPARLLLHI